MLDANVRRYPLIQPDFKYQQILGDSETKIEAEERRLFYVALSRAVSTLDVVTIANERKSPFLESFEALISYGNWDKLTSIRSRNANWVTVRVWGDTYNQKAVLAGQGYVWNGTRKLWMKDF